jgi:hypothetical protein
MRIEFKRRLALLRLRFQLPVAPKFECPVYGHDRTSPARNVCPVRFPRAPSSTVASSHDHFQAGRLFEDEGPPFRARGLPGQEICGYV